jgi:hypothetical protein
MTDPADAAALVLASAQQVADLHRHLRHQAAGRVLGGRPTDPDGAEAAPTRLRALYGRTPSTCWLTPCAPWRMAWGSRKRTTTNGTYAG